MGERITITEVKTDVESAFDGWSAYMETDNAWSMYDHLTPGERSVAMERDRDDIAERHARVLVCLAQVEADQRQRECALAACKAMLEWHTDKANHPIGDALKLAKMAVEPWPVVPVTKSK